jgi:hypothetical protein
MKVVYIAGPFTGKTAWDVECNVREAEKIALQVAKAGAMPLCPHTNSRFFYGQCTADFWYDGTLELLKRCDAIVMLPNWQASKGSLMEHTYAKEHGMQVFYHNPAFGIIKIDNPKVSDVELISGNLQEWLQGEPSTVHKGRFRI